MGVDQLHKQVLFDGFSSKLRIYKPSGLGMLFAEFLCRIEQFKKMKIKSNSINYYQFRSCLRLYLLVKTSIRYPSTAKKASPDVAASCRRARGCKANTTNSIAACTRKQGVPGLFKGVSQQKLTTKEVIYG
jgi:hypothetical protein